MVMKQKNFISAVQDLPLTDDLFCGSLQVCKINEQDGKKSKQSLQPADTLELSRNDRK